MKKVLFTILTVAMIVAVCVACVACTGNDPIDKTTLDREISVGFQVPYSKAMVAISNIPDTAALSAFVEVSPIFFMTCFTVLWVWSEKVCPKRSPTCFSACDAAFAMPAPAPPRPPNFAKYFKRPVFKNLPATSFATPAPALSVALENLN